MIFSGEIHSYRDINDDGGAFCIARPNDFNKPLDLSKYKGITFEVCSRQTMNYSFTLYDREDRGLLHWKSEFAVHAQPEGNTTWERIEIPFHLFLPIRSMQYSALLDDASMDITAIHSVLIGLSKINYRKGEEVYLNSHF